jgi:uncharacterized short protein YbdD (DUF466 family)
LRRAIAFLRRLTGDDDYERYLAHHAAAHPGAVPVDRRTYYLEQQRQKWSGVKRCC